LDCSKISTPTESLKSPLSAASLPPEWACLHKCALQQIAYFQPSSHLPHIAHIQAFSLHSQHPQDVAPLPVGDLFPHALPFQLGQDNILRAGHVRIALGLLAQHPRLTACQLGAIKGAFSGHKDVYILSEPRQEGKHVHLRFGHKRPRRPDGGHGDPCCYGVGQVSGDL
jgi:hypothetical protein